MKEYIEYDLIQTNKIKKRLLTRGGDFEHRFACQINQSAESLDNIIKIEKVEGATVEKLDKIHKGERGKHLGLS